jgi:hypothetical protein
MIRSKLLSKKTEIINSIGMAVTNLIQSTFKYPNAKARSSMSRVNEFEKMRPDLMSNRVYGTQDGWDLLLKYNGISNPFSLNEGDLLYVVNYSDLTAMVNAPFEISERSGKTESDFKPISPDSNKDSNRVSNLRNKYKNRNSQSPQGNSSLPPNLSTRPSIQPEGGQIVLGQNNTTADNNNIGDSLSRSRLKSALLKNRLSL